MPRNDDWTRDDRLEADTRNKLLRDLAEKVRSGQMTPQQAASQAGTTVQDFISSSGVYAQMTQEQVRALGPQGSQERGTGNMERAPIAPDEGHYPSKSGGAPASLGAQPPAPGAAYTGASTDGKTIIWTMPDGSRRYTSVSGQDIAPTRSATSPGGVSTTAPPPNPAPSYTAPAGGYVAPAAPGAPATPAAPVEGADFPKDVGISYGQYKNYKAQVAQVLNQLGFQDISEQWRTMNPLTDGTKLGRIVGFARSGLDLEGIANAFKTDPALNAINPGLKYGLSREDYYLQREGTEGAFAQRFDAPSDLTDVRQRAKDPQAGPAPAEPDWMSAVFHERLSPQESSSMFGDYFQRLGRAPSVDEIGQYKTRSQTRYGTGAVEPAFQSTSGGPSAKGLAGPQKNPFAGVGR